MKITDLTLRHAKPRFERYTIALGKGLTLLVMPDGAKYWRMRYRFGDKARWLSLGRPYPETSMKEAEAECFRMRRLIDEGVDPAEERRAQRAAQREHVAHTFGEAAENWHAFRSKAWHPSTALQVREYLDADILPKLSKRPLASVTARELGDLVAGIEARGAFDVAKKTRQWLKAIFSYSRAKGFTANNPAGDLNAIAGKGPGYVTMLTCKCRSFPSFYARWRLTVAADRW
ncbi:MAG TPA: integrase arm-type DNA-binding domain-containing protein [Verrucomicrobiae bacterium]|nr:integrase arm-type DNA-binding domain-containing protein [Verrucomicrobiae bacterium]